MIVPLVEAGAVVCPDCAVPLVANVGRTLERSKAYAVTLWWECRECREISASIPFPARFLSDRAGTLGSVRRDGADGLQPPGVALAPPRDVRRRPPVR